MPEVLWTPQPGPQTTFVTCPFEEVLYGGSAGGGKTDALLGDFSSGIEQYGSAWHGLIARRSFPMLAEIEKRALEIFSPHYGASSYKKSERTWYFKTAKGTATLKLASIDDDIKVIDHQGQQYSWIGLDEATQWPNDNVLEYLITRTRSPKGSPTYIRLTANPGGVGHVWVKERFRIGDTQDMTPFSVEGRPREGESEARKIMRVFIPARVTDNVVLMKNDPTYIDKLNNIADPVLRKALYEGDWNIIAGAAFPEFSLEHHVCASFEIPERARVIRMMDWGHAKPYCCLWQYVNFDGRTYVIGEMYGKGSKPGTGSMESCPEVWAKIRSFEESMGWNVVQAFLDPQCWAEHGGDSEYKMLGGAKARWQPWPKGPNSRRQHKQLVHDMLKVVNGESRTQIFSECKNLIRTLGTLPIDPRNPEVVDTNAEDHAYDAFRGGNATRATFNRFGRQGRELEFFDGLDAATPSGRPTYGGW